MPSMNPAWDETFQCCDHIAQCLNVYLHPSASCKRWTQSNTTHSCRILEVLVSPASWSASIPWSLCGHRLHRGSPKPFRIDVAHLPCVGPAMDKIEVQRVGENNTPRRTQINILYCSRSLVEPLQAPRAKPFWTNFEFCWARKFGICWSGPIYHQFRISLRSTTDWEQ